VNDDEFWREMVRRYATTLYHPCSTCKMGLVVASDLTVLGVKNLRVADASVFPHEVSGNTNAPSMLIGEKCADFVAAKYGLKLGRPIPPMTTLQKLTTLGLAAAFTSAASKL